MQLFCQWLMALILAVNFFGLVHSDFNGRQPAKPKGFTGFISSLITIGLLAWLHYGAGAFSLILP